MGCMLCTADALLHSAALRAAVGDGLPHLALLMPDAVGDVGSGADLATGQRSLVDWPPWIELIALLQRAYGARARCVLYRAPVWASTAEACMLSAPLTSLACRSCVDGIVRAWGGDLGTMYLAGGGGEASAGGGGEGSSGGGGEGSAARTSDATRCAAAHIGHAAEIAGEAVEMADDAPTGAAADCSASLGAAVASGGGMLLPASSSHGQPPPSSFDAERQAWLRA